MDIDMVQFSSEGLTDIQCSLNENVFVCLLSTQSFLVWLVLYGFEAEKRWMLQREGIGEGLAQLHSGRWGRAVQQSLQALGMN